MASKDSAEDMRAFLPGRDRAVGSFDGSGGLGISMSPSYNRMATQSPSDKSNLPVGSRSGIPPFEHPQALGGSPYPTEYCGPIGFTRGSGSADYGFNQRRVGQASQDKTITHYENGIPFPGVPQDPREMFDPFINRDSRGRYAGGQDLSRLYTNAIYNTTETNVQSVPEHSGVVQDEDNDSNILDEEENAFDRPEEMGPNSAGTTELDESTGLPETHEQTADAPTPKAGRRTTRKRNRANRRQAEYDETERDTYGGLIAHRRPSDAAASDGIQAPFQRRNPQPESHRLDKKSYRSVLLLTAPKRNHQG